MKIISIHFLLFFLTVSFTAQANDADAGKSKITTCIACHGANGIGTSDTYPNLAGQKRAYLISSIKAYKDGSRTGGLTGVMQPMVGTLSDQDIADIATYYSNLPISEK